MFQSFLPPFTTALRYGRRRAWDKRFFIRKSGLIPRSSAPRRLIHVCILCKKNSGPVAAAFMPSRCPRLCRKTLPAAFDSFNNSLFRYTGIAIGTRGRRELCPATSFAFFRKGFFNGFPDNLPYIGNN
jgi:hypothetical protein